MGGDGVSGSSGDPDACFSPVRAPFLANFGASDEAILAVVTGKAQPEGKLPFELPGSMEAVRAQNPDAPHDSKSPLFPLFFGLQYSPAQGPITKH